MKNSVLITYSLLISLSVCSIVCYKERNILQNEFKDKTKSLENLREWRTKLKDEFIKQLKSMPDTVKNAIIADADKILTTQWKTLLAMNFLEYKINGSSPRYETPEKERWQRLEALLLAELLTANGKYLNEIVNGLWLNLEQSTWMRPAHVSAQKAGIGLPDPTEIIIDLGLGERSAFVAWLKFLVGDKLSHISPMITKRIDYELNKRIIDPFLHRNHKNWMGLEGQKVNNWNTFINTHVLATTLLIIEQNKTLEIISKVMISADDWLNWYGDDGGCDEGPGYWNIAGGRFIQLIYYMTSASNRQMDWSKNELINNIGSYIYKMHIDKDYFVNFADAPAKQIFDPTSIHLFGQTFNNTVMREFAAYLYHLNPLYINHKDYSGDLDQYYFQMQALPLLQKITPKAPQPMESWFSDIQVTTLRSEKGSAKGIFLGAKAGNNGESHNHNDVGHFILYVDGLPGIIDVGVGPYTSKTFSGHRYEIWTMQSQWHNTPTINGVQQHNGVEYKANNVTYHSESGKTVFKADIASAYPKEAHVKNWVRILTFDRTHTTVELSESYSLEKYVEPSKIHFITILNASHVKDSGEVVLQNEKTKLVMKFDSKIFDVVADEHSTESKKLSDIWGQRIVRVTLLMKQKDLVGKHSILFHK